MTSHRIESYGVLTLFGCLCLAACLSGFSSDPAQRPVVLASKVIPVEWTNELVLGRLLIEATVANTQHDLSRLLAQPWYASIDVKTSKANQKKSLSSCNDYFLHKELGLRAEHDHDINPLLEFIVMCEAARLLSQATPAKYSKIPKNPLDAQLPKKLPKALALLTSKIEWNRAQNNPKLTHWSEVNSITKVEKKSAHQSIYYSNGGAQTLSILGHGDINGNKDDDILVAVKDTVTGGTYFNFRLFVLTVTEQGKWRIIAQY